MSGLRGPVAHCELGKMHDDAPRPDRPSAAYLAYPMPCEAPSCDGRLVCVGHAVCPPCAAAIRAGLTEWEATQHDVDLTLLHAATGPHL